VFPLSPGLSPLLSSGENINTASLLPFAALLLLLQVKVLLALILIDHDVEIFGWTVT
jgi:hypothetical protein